MTKNPFSSFAFHLTLVGFLSFSLWGSPVLAEENLMEMSLEELLNVSVEVASKKQEKVSEAPGIITVVTRKEIESFGAVTLVDVLNRVPSLQLMSSHLWVQSKSVIRGDLITHTDTHVLTLINGRPFRETQEGDASHILYTTFPVELIERIEIIRGPGSVLYGTNAVAGVINIVTKKAEEPEMLPVKLKYTGGGGSYGANMHTVSAYGKGEDWDLSMAYNAFQEDGWELDAWTVSPPPAFTPLDGKADYAEQNWSFSAFFNYNDRLTANVFYGDSQYHAIGTLPYWERESDVDNERLFVDLGYRHPLSETWNLNVNVTRNDYDKNIITDTFPDGDGSEEPDSSIGTLVEASVGGQFLENGNLIIGALTDEHSSVKIVDPVPGETGSAIPESYLERSLSAYGQVDYRFFDRLKLIAGAQYNKIDSGEDDIVPRGGMIVDITDAIGVKVLYAEAFRAPTAQERFFGIPILTGNPDLSPETVRTLDTQVFFNTAKGQYSLTYFNTHMEDLIVRVLPPPDTTFENSDEAVDIWGLEFEGKLQINDPLFVTASATYQKEKDKTLYIPSIMAKAGVAYNKDNYVVGLFYSYFGKPEENNGAELNDAANGISLLSLNATYKFKLMVPMAVNVYGMNLLNDDMSYTEFARGWVNTLPIGPGISVFGRFTIEI
jgi:outer membrane receptor for ferrienterochelin and colicins